MSCRKLLSEISNYLDGEIDPAARRELEEHIARCPNCLVVFDTTRKASVKELTAWVDGVRESVGPIPVYALGNKIDLNGRRETNDDDVRAVLSPYEAPVLYTSAKTGVNVEEAFQGLAKTIVENAVS